MRGKGRTTVFQQCAVYGQRKYVTGKALLCLLHNVSHSCATLLATPCTNRDFLVDTHKLLVTFTNLPIASVGKRTLPI